MYLFYNFLHVQINNCCQFFVLDFCDNVWAFIYASSSQSYTWMYSCDSYGHEKDDGILSNVCSQRSDSSKRSCIEKSPSICSAVLSALFHPVGGIKVVCLRIKLKLDNEKSSFCISTLGWPYWRRPVTVGWRCV